MKPKKNLKKLEGFKINKEGVNITPYTYRYIMEFPLGNTMFNWLVDCELPSVRVTSVRTNRNFVGDYLTEWNPIQIKFRDIVGETNNQNEFYRRIRDWFSDYNYTNQKINTTIHRIYSHADFTSINPSDMNNLNGAITQYTALSNGIMTFDSSAWGAILAHSAVAPHPGP